MKWGKKTLKWNDQINKDISIMKTLDKKHKFEFIWDYYKIPIIALASVISLIILTLIINVGRGDIMMYAMLINADDSGSNTIFTDVLKQGGTDMNGKDVDVMAGYTLSYDDYNSTDGETVQVLAASFGIGDLDLFVANEPVYSSYVAQEAFIDLSLFVEKEDLAQYDLYTYMGDEGREIVAGVWLHEGSPLHQAGYYTDDVIIGVAANAQNLDPAVNFMKSLIKNF